MRNLLIGLALAATAVPASSALNVGTKAPDFTAPGAFNGKPVTVHLAEKLKHGPVVLYFFPKAGMPVMRKPFFAIQKTCSTDRSPAALARFGGRGFIPGANSPGSAPEPPWQAWHMPL